MIFILPTMLYWMPMAVYFRISIISNFVCSLILIWSKFHKRELECLYQASLLVHIAAIIVAIGFIYHYDVLQITILAIFCVEYIIFVLESIYRWQSLAHLFFQGIIIFLTGIEGLTTDIWYIPLISISFLAVENIILFFDPKSLILQRLLIVAGSCTYASILTNIVLQTL